MKHTKEPWVVVLDRGTKIASDVEDGYIVETKRDDIDVVNACRIVACVNACADVENYCLKQGYVKGLQKRIAELELSVKNLEEKLTKKQEELNYYKYC